MKYDWFNTLDEFIEWELRVNKGSDIKFIKKRIENMYKELYPNMKIKNNLTKDELIDEILKKKSLLDIYNENKESFGIKSTNGIGNLI